MLQRGDYNGAIAHLSKPDMADDANAQLVLGHAYSAKNEAPNAINAYRRALAINTSLQKNSDLRANLRTMAADKNPEIVQNAFDVWVGHTDDASAKELLLKAVVSPTSADRRAAARNVLDLHKLGDELVRVKSYSLDLTDQQLTCPQRGEAVGKLRAIGNPAAIPALERAMELKGKQGAMKGKLLNACFIEEARAARGVLNSLKKK